MGLLDHDIAKMDRDERIDRVAFYKKAYPDKYKQFEKRANENSRYAHLQSISTRLIFTMNVRSLINFFNHRCCFRAQEEIREMATKVLQECIRVAPMAFSKAGPKCLYETCPEGSMSCGRQYEVKSLFKGGE